MTCHFKSFVTGSIRTIQPCVQYMGQGAESPHRSRTNVGKILKNQPIFGQRLAISLAQILVKNGSFDKQSLDLSFPKSSVGESFQKD